MKHELPSEKNNNLDKVTADTLENVNAGMIIAEGCSHDPLIGERFKKNSLFGWNWYRKCAQCGRDVFVDYGPWSGSAD